MHTERDFTCSSSSNYIVRLEGPPDYTESIVHGSVYFVNHVLVGTSDDDGAGLNLLASIEEDEIIVSDVLFLDFFTFSQP